MMRAPSIIDTWRFLLLFCTIELISATSSTFRVITGDQESRLDLRIDNQKLLEIAAKVGECAYINVDKTSQTAIVQHGVTVIMNCSQLLRSEDTVITWYQLSLNQFNGVPTGDPRVLIKDTDRLRISGTGNSILTIPRTNIIEGAMSHDSNRYTCSANTTGMIRSRNITVFLVGGPPYLDEGGCEVAEIGTQINCIVGKNITEPLRLPMPRITTLSMQCVIHNLDGASSSNPAYPTPTYKWKKGNITVIENGELTDAFDMEYSQLMMINPFPIITFRHNSFLVNFEYHNISGGMDQVPVITCGDRMVMADWQKYILYSIVGTWTCEVENSLGSDRGELTILEPDLCTNAGIAQCGAADECQTAAGEFCCNCPEVGYTSVEDGKNCTDIDECADPSLNNCTEKKCQNLPGNYTCSDPCRDVLMAMNNEGRNIVIETYNNIHFANLSCESDEYSQGYQTCTLDQNDRAVVETVGLLVCAPVPVRSPCNIVCIIIVVVAVLLIILVVVLLVVFICMARDKWWHNYYIGKIEGAQGVEVRIMTDTLKPDDSKMDT